MKYILFFGFLITGCAVLAVSTVQNESVPKVYEGSAMGYRGPIHVQVHINAGAITEITVVDSMEDRFVGGTAIEELIDIVIENNSTDVDAISGATVTSKGFLSAVNNAIMSYE
jgi:fumarate reductase flavoprotein subunit